MTMRGMVVLFAAIFMVSTVAAAQHEGARTLTPAAVADSQSVLSQMTTRVLADKSDAPAWYRRGMIAWALAIRARGENPPRELDATRLARLADTSLRTAAELAPDSAEYQTAIGILLLETGNPSARVAATEQFDRAAAAARKNGTPEAKSRAFLEAAQAHWRHYDNFANRRMEIVPDASIRSLTEGGQVGQKAAQAAGDPLMPPILPMKSIIQNWLNGTAPISSEVNGDGDYRVANDLFREAYAAMPNDTRTVRSVAMVLAEKNRWSELESFARAHVARYPKEPIAWMALGLALQRTARSSAAEIPFDSALRNMTPSERFRLDRMQRIRPPTSDTSLLAKRTPAEREALEKLYWMLAKPLWSDKANMPRVEFLARVTFAELRWTVDESNVKGADTDRGNVYIRNGQPKTIGTSQPNTRDVADNPRANELTTVWIYESGLMFVFKGALSFATAESAPEDRSIVTEILNTNPVRWDNVAIPTLDSMPTQVARFRAGRDSVDLVVSTAPNVEMIQPPVQNAPPVTASVWWATLNSSILFRDSLSLKASRNLSFAHRLPRGSYLLRAEATSEQAARASRRSVVVDAVSPTAFPASGFGMSDLLLAASVVNSGGAAQRWRDLSIAPIAEAIPPNSTLALVWENYEFGSRDGSSQYEVVVTLAPSRSTAGRIAATVLGALASAARIDHKSDRVIITIDRTAPYAFAFADAVNVSLQGTPAGEYDVSLQVTDRVTKQVVARTKHLIIR